MEAERFGGGTNQNTAGSGAGRNPNGPKTVLGPPSAAPTAAAPSAAAGAMPGSSQPREQQDGEAGLSLPGILHFIQYEWGRFQAEKYRWEAERDELRAQVAFLQGERKGQENMKQDLVRRIKMLEYALKQERAKYQKLKTGTDQSPGEKRPDTENETTVLNGPADLDIEPSNQMTWKEGRQLLRKYLEEVGYSDTILDMRSKRVRSLLGRSSPEVNGPPCEVPSEPESHARGESLLVRQIEEQIKRNAGKENSKERVGSSVLDKISFLRSCQDDEEDSDEDDDFQGIATDCIDGPRKNKKSQGKMGDEPLTTVLDPEDEEDEEDSEDALNEFDFLGSGEESEGAGEARISGDGRELENRRNKLQGIMSDFPPKSSQPASIQGQCRSGEGGTLGFSSDVFILDAVGGGDINLGELADLTVANDNEVTNDLQDSREEFKKTWNPRFTLRSHFDAIRALTFHPSEAVLLTASEDGTLKLWNLNKAMHSKKNAALDVEPVYTFRAHSGAVLSLSMGEDGETCYSGGLDGSVRCWKIPDLNVDPYDNYDPGVESSVLLGHEDSVWDLAYSPTLKRLASCSADGTVRIWDPQSSSPCISVFNKEKEHGTPTSIAFGNADVSQAVVSFDGGETVLYDLNTEQSILVLETQTKDGSKLINRVVSHPSEQISITAHENRTIRFMDNKTGKVVHSMVAHLDAVTCLTTDPKGTYLVSGSHDCSVRLWMLDNRTCVQEITAHRKKHDEAIHDVAFHPSQPFIASAGADALAKIFV
ncbi:striatin-4 isoform X1 [Astyanax mexicanus]|uniref:striatin-4 isoform X1 n=1 Tax=Astyanax mexicanus TaxID=7994 RepID=UPI0020CABD9E|nr:striatin-4 isoform X1 [Astyanax mexicanus]XP_049323352.1 striatin-4 isoform X1 [Astyanax mexicanus]XP_049323353.1 striatin-4 isoform X1 [Astyanax mexicanus]